MPATTTFQPILPLAGEAALRTLATPLLSDNMDRLSDTIAAAQAKLRAEQAIMAEIEGGAERQSWLYGLLGQMGIQV